jgi:hypothetical protein
MSVGTGITRESLDSLGDLIDRDGLLDGNPVDPNKQRTDEHPPNPQIPEEELAAAEDDPAPEDEEPTEEELAAAEGGEEGEEAAEPEAEEPTIETIAALAEEFNATEEDVLQSLTVDNGLGQTVTLGDALEGWRQTAGHIHEIQGKLETEHRELINETNAKIDTELSQLGGLTAALIDELKAEFESVDLPALKLSDPARYADLIEKRQRRTELISRAADRFQVNAGEREQQAQGDRDALATREMNTLFEKMPEWKRDSKKSVEAIQENMQLMRAMNFSDEEINSVVDHRQVIILHWAAQYRKMLAKAKGKTLEELRKKKGLRRPGLVDRATARVDMTTPQDAQAKKRKASFRKSQSMEDAAGVLETMFK